MVRPDGVMDQVEHAKLFEIEMDRKLVDAVSADLTFLCFFIIMTGRI
jgi:hypothetical protein